jgi:hypothetical protein
MGADGFPENVRQLVFKHIDSVEQLEVLLYMRAHRETQLDALRISAELRSIPASVLKRIVALETCGFISRPNKSAQSETIPSETTLFQFNPRTGEIDSAISALADLYKSKPQRIFEIIFSPLKKGRQFAAAFVVTTPKKDTDNG